MSPAVRGSLLSRGDDHHARPCPWTPASGPTAGGRTRRYGSETRPTVRPRVALLRRFRVSNGDVKLVKSCAQQLEEGREGPLVESEMKILWVLAIANAWNQRGGREKCSIAGELTAPDGQTERRRGDRGVTEAKRLALQACH